MADYEVSVAIDVTVTEVAGGTADVASPSIITRTFTVPDGDFQNAIDELATAAEAAGWTLTERGAIGFNGEKRIDDLNAQIEITGTDDNNHVWVKISSR